MGPRGLEILRLSGGKRGGGCPAALRGLRAGRWIPIEEIPTHGRGEAGLKLLSALLKAEEEGWIRFRFTPFSRELISLQNMGWKENPFPERPGFDYISGVERSFIKGDSPFDFASPSSKWFHLKEAEKGVYLDLFAPFLEGVDEGERVLDGGGGTGRFSVSLLEMGFRPVLVDASPSSLRAAMKNLFSSQSMGRFREEPPMFDLFWADIEYLPFMKDGEVPLLFLIEVLSYHSRPGRVLREAARILKKGGTLFVSVESRGGIATAGYMPSELESVLDNGLFHKEGGTYVKYYNPRTLRGELEDAGFEVTLLKPTHFILEGPLYNSCDLKRLKDPEYRGKILELERRLSREAGFPGRAITAVAKRVK